MNYRADRLINKYFVLLWLNAFALCTAQNIFNNIISVYVVSVGYSNAFAGSLAIPYAILAIVGRFFSAYVSDNISRRATMLTGAAAFAVGSAFYCIPALSIPAILLFFRGLTGFGFACENTAYFAAAGDVAPRKKMSLSTGLVSAAQGVSQIVCGILIAVMIAGDNYSPLFAISTAVCVMAFGFAFFCNYEKKDGSIRTAGEKKELRLSDFIEKSAMPIALWILVYFFGISVMTFYTLTKATEMGIPRAGLFFTASAIGMVVANVFLARVAEWMGSRNAVLMVTVIAITACLGINYMCSLSVLLIAGFLYGVAIGPLPLIQCIAVEKLPANKRGAATSTIFMTMDVAMGVSPVVWGAIIDASGFSSAFIGAALVLLIAAVLTFRVYKN